MTEIESRPGVDDRPATAVSSPPGVQPGRPARPRRARTSRRSAAWQTSASTPDDANSRSSTMPAACEPGGVSLTVAETSQRYLLECRLQTRTLRPQVADQASAATSSATATATSTSRVKRGSARMDTARPPTSAHGSARRLELVARPDAARRAAATSLGDGSRRAGGTVDPPGRPVVREATRRRAPRAAPESRPDAPDEAPPGAEADSRLEEIERDAETARPPGCPRPRR